MFCAVEADDIYGTHHYAVHFWCYDNLAAKTRPGTGSGGKNTVQIKRLRNGQNSRSTGLQERINHRTEQSRMEKNVQQKGDQQKKYIIYI